MALGMEDTGLPMQSKKNGLTESLQIRVLRVVSATDELFIKRL